MNYVIYSIEDDEDISKIINKTLSKNGYEVQSFKTGSDFFKVFEKAKPDLILLDLMLPDINGYEILKKIRADSLNDNVEIIILSAKRMLMDKVEGLDLGADDYIEKPFDLLELMSRVNARLRRHEKTNILSYEDLTLDIEKHIVTYHNKTLDLTNKEFDILKILLSNVSKVVSRDELLNSLWGTNEADYETRTIDMHIKGIRNKLNDKDGNIIQTIYGIGYKIGK